MADVAKRTHLSAGLRCGAALFVIVVADGAAFAQDFGGTGGARYWFEENMRAQRARPAPYQAPRIRRLMPHRQFARPTIWHERPTPAERIVPSRPSTQPVPHREPAVASVPAEAKPGVAILPAPDAPKQKPFVVAVVGDNLAQWLAVGLTDAFPADQGITIVNKTRDSSGLVRDDFYDWPKALREFVGATPPDALVIMIGSNDRQPLRGAGGVEEPLSKGWEASYGKRVETLVGIARDKKIPVLWVGLPIMKSERFSTDIGAINEIDRSRSESAGAHFIDVFDAFADERGAYSAFGPDVNGQIVKLRTGDGIHFTPAGARKLAHFLEADLRKLHDAVTPPAPPAVAGLPPVSPIEALPSSEPPPAGTPAEASSGESAVAAVPLSPEPAPRPAAGPVIPLTAAPSTPGGELLGKPGANGKVTDTQRAAVELLGRQR